MLAISHKNHTTDPARIQTILRADPKFQARVKTYGLQPNWGPREISPGPGFVTKDSLSTVIKYAGVYR